MDNKNFNNDQKIEFWSNHSRAWENSGLSRKKYCENEMLSYWSFRTWYAKLKPEYSKSKKFIKIQNSNPIRFSEQKIEISISSGIKIIVSENVSHDTLIKIFKAAGA